MQYFVARNTGGFGVLVRVRVLVNHCGKRRNTAGAAVPYRTEPNRTLISIGAYSMNFTESPGLKGHAAIVPKLVVRPSPTATTSPWLALSFSAAWSKRQQQQKNVKRRTSCQAIVKNRLNRLSFVYFACVHACVCMFSIPMITDETRECSTRRATKTMTRLLDDSMP